MKKIGWRVIPVAIFCLLCFFLWRGLSLDPHHLPSARIGKPLPDFALPELQNPDSTFSAINFHNQVVLLNVWASWCEACVEEQVFMLQLAREGVPIYGLNYKDNPEHARAWLAQWGNPYRLIGQDSEGKVAIDLGVYGAPETFVIDKKGIVRYRHVGIMNQKTWLTDILPLMRNLEKS
ncbi:TPA: DsbE family thiol:disulfide interchange protein [Legionella pneumophila]|uniref:DsbE family thiol:disulfide interchange protein n=1 Tax=Legionella TaxID=445 RepID=UPI0004847FFD|nr:MULTISPECIES: DsbE family thiol:disulfide interchange protein [Legionella]MCK1870452.1 DsbE family thiol:disulfide interchange protein [Legionella pneumophila]MCW8395506.1 DsbE family thiol:disulfide interchange protein [Legionella sp. PATHC039]MCZ4723805.1 DsbE family thiol:disulfide interchange protein [Legionella pneumophila]MCZ4724923.1 DsbE family thiol:disulfide interchange protein [Legionella pneumophila]MCZ4728733.1 DsbE family thiol:disulfide interchange protein [Legionella pneumop